MNARRLLLSLSIVLTGCDAPVANTSTYLEPTTANEELPEAGELCFLATDDEPNDYVRLIAKRREGVVRVHGSTVRLSYEGERLRGGGTFRAGTLTIRITGIPTAAARSNQRIGEMATVTVRDRDVAEQFTGLWTC